VCVVCEASNAAENAHPIHLHLQLFTLLLHDLFYPVVRLGQTSCAKDIVSNTQRARKCLRRPLRRFCLVVVLVYKGLSVLFS